MLEILKTLKETPLPTVLVIGGLIFLLIPFIEIIFVKEAKVATTNKQFAGFIGFILLVTGIGLYIIPSKPSTLPIAISPSVIPAIKTPIIVSATWTIQPTTIVQPSVTPPIVPSPLPTNPPVTEILPEGVASVNEMPNWLAANVGGTLNQWQQVQNGKWRFKAGNSGGVGDNQILSPKVGYLVFGADSGQKDSNGGVIWKDVSIGPGESTFWRCSDSNKPGTIDTAEWTLFNPNIGTSCN